VQLTGGMLSNSLPLFSDSFHILTHLLPLPLSMLAIYFPNRKPTPPFTYPYLPFQILPPFLNPLPLSLISIG
ncbi:cation transporter, partial [Staphylococcus haemolyticus]|uniref:cation transporter n=1 Tax=Staphylococcus haemolyticus TaxID=1283 RepID=UPI0016428F2E